MRHPLRFAGVFKSMMPENAGSCWCVARRTLMIFVAVALVVYLSGGLETSVVAAR